MSGENKPWPPLRRKKIYVRKSRGYGRPIRDEAVAKWHIPPLDKENHEDDRIEDNTFMGLMLKLFDDWSYQVGEISIVWELVNGESVEVFETDEGWQLLLPKPMEKWEREFFESTKSNLVAKKLTEEIIAMLDAPI